MSRSYTSSPHCASIDVLWDCFTFFIITYMDYRETNGRMTVNVDLGRTYKGTLLDQHLAVLWLRLLDSGHSRRSNGFAPGSVNVGFVVEKVAAGQVFLRSFESSRNPDTGKINVLPSNLRKERNYAV
jgi:hypothetical protein